MLLRSLKKKKDPYLSKILEDYFKLFKFQISSFRLHSHIDNS